VLSRQSSWLPLTLRGPEPETGPSAGQWTWPILYTLYQPAPPNRARNRAFGAVTMANTLHTLTSQHQLPCQILVSTSFSLLSIWSPPPTWKGNDGQNIFVLSQLHHFYLTSLRLTPPTKIAAREALPEPIMVEQQHETMMHDDDDVTPTHLLKPSSRSSLSSR
jgi:hypothetical protein